MYLNQNKAFAIIFFVFSPIISLVFALGKFNDRTKLLFLTLFGSVYGFTINYLEGNDAWTHAQSLKTYYDLDLNDFIDRFWGIISFNPAPNSPSDLYIHFLFGITGSIFQSPILLFTIVGTVYGYFYGNALLKVIRLPKTKKITVLMFSLITLFVILRSFENMQTIRSWTGMWVLFNGVLGYYQTKNKKYILLIICSPFFHLMYGFIALPALILVFFKSPPRQLIIGLYLVSFIANVNTLSVVNIASENELSQNKLQSYYRVDAQGDEIDTIGERREESNAVWYAKYGKTDAVYYGSTYFIFFLILAGYYKKSKMTNIEFNLLSIGILIASLANFLSFSYAFYSRTMANASLYILAVMVLMALRGNFKIINEGRWKIVFVWLGVFIFIPKVLYFSSDFMYRTSMLLFGFPFLNFFGDDFNFSIRDFINVFL